MLLLDGEFILLSTESLLMAIELAVSVLPHDVEQIESDEIAVHVLQWRSRSSLAHEYFFQIINHCCCLSLQQLLEQRRSTCVFFGLLLLFGIVFLSLSRVSYDAAFRRRRQVQTEVTQFLKNGRVYL